jgi:hypothetical protein
MRSKTQGIQKEAKASKMKVFVSVWRLAPREIRGLLIAVPQRQQGHDCVI